MKKEDAYAVRGVLDEYNFNCGAGLGSKFAWNWSDRPWSLHSFKNMQTLEHFDYIFWVENFANFGEMLWNLKLIIYSDALRQHQVHPEGYCFLAGVPQGSWRSKITVHHLLLIDRHKACQSFEILSETKAVCHRLEAYFWHFEILLLLFQGCTSTYLNNVMHDEPKACKWELCLLLLLFFIIKKYS